VADYFFIWLFIRRWTIDPTTITLYRLVCY